MLRRATKNVCYIKPIPSWVSPIVSERATIYIEMEKLIQNENLIESGKKFISNL